MRKKKKLHVFEKIYLHIRGRNDAKNNQFIPIENCNVKISPFVRTEMKRFERYMKDSWLNDIYWVNLERGKRKRLMKITKAMASLENDKNCKTDKMKENKEKYEAALKVKDTTLTELEKKNEGNVELHRIRKVQQDFAEMTASYETLQRELHEDQIFAEEEARRIRMIFKADMELSFEYHLLRLYYYFEKANKVDPSIKASLLNDEVFREYRVKIHELLNICEKNSYEDTKEYEYNEKGIER